MGRKRRVSLLEKKIKGIRLRQAYEERQKNLGIKVHSVRLSVREIEYVKMFLSMLKKIDPDRVYEDCDVKVSKKGNGYSFYIEKREENG